MTVCAKMQKHAFETGQEKVDSSSSVKQKAMSAGQGNAQDHVEHVSNQDQNVNGPDTPVKEQDGRLGAEVRGQRESACLLVCLHVATWLCFQWRIESLDRKTR